MPDDVRVMEGMAAMRCYGLRAAAGLPAVVLCSAALLSPSPRCWLGLAGAAVRQRAADRARAAIIYFHSERMVLTALRARPVSEVERPDLYRIVRELAFSAHLPVPRLLVSPAEQPNILTVGYGARSAAVCCTEGLLPPLASRTARRARARARARVQPRPPGSTFRRLSRPHVPAGLASLVALELPADAPCCCTSRRSSAGREYDADMSGALLTGDPLALAGALRKIDAGRLGPGRCARAARVTAASHLMIAHPFPPDGLGGLLSTHPPTSERVRRLEALSGYRR